MLSWEFPPRIIGGISTHVYHLSKALAARGISVHVTTCDFPKAPAQELVNGVHVSRVDSGQVPQANFLLWIYHLNSQMIRRGKEILKAENFDLIHAHDWLVGRAAIELKDHYDTPLVTTIHATETGRGGTVDTTYRKKVHDIERLLVQHSERVICCSNYMVHHIQHNLEVPAGKIHVIPNGVDLSTFNNSDRSGSVRTKLGLGEGKIILYVGRIVREKGVFTLLDAFVDLRKQGKNASLVFVGDGPLRENLAREALRRGMKEHVHFTGFIDEPSLVDLYRSSDVFVLPSLYEPFGIAALEAMAAHTPVVVSDVGGLSEIVEDGVTGVKVPHGEPMPLAKALIRVLEDDAFASQLKQNAYRSIQARYGWDLVAEKTLEAYSLVTSQAPSPTTATDEDFLTEQGLLHFLLTMGATGKNVAKSAGEIASLIKAPEIPVKLILGRQASRGYVSTTFGPDLPDVKYHLSEAGIIKACSDLS